MTAGQTLFVATLAFLPGLLWAVIARDILTFLVRRRPPGQIWAVLLALTAAAALHFFAWTVFLLLPPETRAEPCATRGMVLLLLDGALVLIVTLGRHAAVLWPVQARPPSRGWLVVNYAIGAVVGGVFAAAHLGFLALPDRGWRSLFALFAAYFGLAGGLVLRYMNRLAQRGLWRPGGLGELRSADTAMMALGCLCVVGTQLVPALAGTSPLALMIEDPPSRAALLVAMFHGGAGLAMAVPFVVRILGDILPEFLTAVLMVASVAATYLGARSIRGEIAGPELQQLVDFGSVLLIVFLLVPGRNWVQRLIAHAVFRRGRLRWGEIQRFLHTLSPEVGVGECCRRTLVELARAMQLHGAAALLYDGQTIVHGSLRIDRLARVWPRGGGGGLPARAFGPIEFRGLPYDLGEALGEAGVVAVVPIASPRRRWGDAFVTTDLRGASFSDEDDEAVDVFAAQLALVLDAAELLARAVAVERSLAHAEKLAAIGELAARIAHEIRNPVTAARSLAQQLGREPDSPLNGEHAQIIVTELERVERQVRALLRFARRETIEPAPVDVVGLVRATVADLRERLAGAGIRIEEDLSPAMTVWADREKLRQVLINLIENAADALADPDVATKWVRVAVRAENGTAAITVTDSGPGVPADALPRLFEPFFSLKANGTGLGLAIARRTVDAHGGGIHAERAAAGGLTVRIVLPQSAVRAAVARADRGTGVETERQQDRSAQLDGPIPERRPGEGAGTDGSSVRWAETRDSKIEGSR